MQTLKNLTIQLLPLLRVMTFIIGFIYVLTFINLNVSGNIGEVSSIGQNTIVINGKTINCSRGSNFHVGEKVFLTRSSITPVLFGNFPTMNSFSRYYMVNTASF